MQTLCVATCVCCVARDEQIPHTSATKEHTTPSGGARPSAGGPSPIRRTPAARGGGTPPPTPGTPACKQREGDCNGTGDIGSLPHHHQPLSPSQKECEAPTKGRKGAHFLGTEIWVTVTFRALSSAPNHSPTKSLRHGACCWWWEGLTAGPLPLPPPPKPTKKKRHHARTRRLAPSSLIRGASSPGRCTTTSPTTPATMQAGIYRWRRRVLALQEERMRRARGGGKVSKEKENRASSPSHRPPPAPHWHLGLRSRGAQPPCPSPTHWAPVLR